MTKNNNPARIEYYSGWTHWQPKGLCSLHEHPYIEIVYHLKGSGWTELPDGFRLDFSEGSIVVYPPYTPHNQVLHREGEDLVVHMIYNPLPEELQQTFFLSKVKSSSLLSDLNILASPPVMRSGYVQMEYDYRAAAVLCKILGYQNSFTGSINQSIDETLEKKAYTYIKKNYHKINSISQIADEIGISYDYLRHIFKKKYGFSMQDFLQITRLERVCELLTYSKLPIKNIAALCGFGSDRYLCSAFRKYKKMTPGDFRNKWRIPE